MRVATVKTGELAFGQFRLDQANALLWRGQERVELAPKPFELLCCLAERPGELVKKDALLNALWSDLHVTESSLTVAMNALRSTLGDDRLAPRYIETVRRRGYRFIASVSVVRSPAVGQKLEEEVPVSDEIADPRRSWRVGRAVPLEILESVLQRVLAGRRQVVFVTGEAGIGKTTFIQMAMEQLSRYRVDVLCGRCTERFGANEAFLPLIDALMTRCRGPGGAAVLEAIRARAPTWLLQMPGFLEGADRAAFQNDVFGATRERMLREFCDLVETLSVERPWVIVIEDMHWSDFATLDVLSRLAREDRKASALVLATYRPTDTIGSGHPVRRLHQDLEIHGRCGELQLDRLSRTEVELHIALRFQDEKLAAALSGPMFGRSRGHPLFIASFVDYLVNQQAIVEIDGAWRLQSGNAFSQDAVPNDLINMITHRIDRLTEDERRLLEVASVAGSECSAALVAAGLARDAVEVEQALEALARKDHTLAPSGASEWPDGTYSGSYAFHHILYQNVLYQRLAPSWRVQIHRRGRAKTRFSEPAAAAHEAHEWFAGGLDFVRRRRQAALIAWMVGPTPRMAISLFKL